MRRNDKEQKDNKVKMKKKKLKKSWINCDNKIMILKTNTNANTYLTATLYKLCTLLPMLVNPEGGELRQILHGGA